MWIKNAIKKYEPKVREILNIIKTFINQKIAETKQNLEDSIPKINTAFETCDFGCLLTELEDYDKNVKKHYKEFLRATEVWDELKIKMIEDERYN